MSKMKEMFTNYYFAVHWLGNHYIFCPNIKNVDQSVYENLPELEYGTDIFQWFLSDCSENDVRQLRKAFPGLIFSYSEKLDLYVLCVDHFQASWDEVMIETTREDAVRGEGEKK